MRAGLVAIMREYLGVHERMRELFARYRAGGLDFDSVRALFDDTDRSPLFRLKERCHGLFRADTIESGPMRREMLFDLSVGSLFHEAMKFRENFYQEVVYAPRVLALRDQADGEEHELFREFEKILAAAEVRLDEALQEAESLLALTREQLRLVLAGRRDGLLARYLIGQRERVARTWPGGAEALLGEMFGGVDAAFAAAAASWLDSGHFHHAIAVLEEARERGARDGAIDRALQQARGMSAFLAGDYAACLDALEAWVALLEGDAGAPADASVDAQAALARSALAQVGTLVEGREADPLRQRAEALAQRLAARLPPSHAA